MTYKQTISQILRPLSIAIGVSLSGCATVPGTVQAPTIVPPSAEVIADCNKDFSSVDKGTFDEITQLFIDERQARIECIRLAKKKTDYIKRQLTNNVTVIVDKR